MYEDLVKRLRNRANGSYEEKCEGCEFTEDFPPCVHCTIKAFNDAADAIEELSREIDIDNAAMTAIDAAVPRWIPAMERLPDAEPGDVSERVLVTDGKDVAIVEWFNFEECEPFWGYTGFGKDVTHWMPLPQPPKEESL